MWQHICDHNSGKSRWILIIFVYLETKTNTLWSKLFTCLFYMWRKYDVIVMFMTLMSCDGVCCMCGEVGAVANWWHSWSMANTLAYLC